MLNRRTARTSLPTLCHTLYFFFGSTSLYVDCVLWIVQRRLVKNTLKIFGIKMTILLGIYCIKLVFFLNSQDTSRDVILEYTPELEKLKRLLLN